MYDFGFSCTRSREDGELDLTMVCVFSSEYSRGTEGQEAEFRLKGLIIIINNGTKLGKKSCEYIGRVMN